LKLHEQKKSVREIETALKEKGHKISKSTVSNVINKQPKAEISTSKIPNDKE
jgi:arginine repressor